MSNYQIIGYTLGKVPAVVSHDADDSTLYMVMAKLMERDDVATVKAWYSDMAKPIVIMKKR